MSQVKKVKTTFVPLNDCIFEDAMLRKQDERNLFLCNMISDNDWKEEYTNFFLPQSKLSVPHHIIKEHLVPYIHKKKHMFYMLEDIDETTDHGVFLTVDENGEIVRVRVTDEVMFHVCPKRWLNIWNPMVKTKGLKDGYKSYTCGATVYVDKEEHKEEMERRFWIMVFGRAFHCSWYKFSGYEWLH